MACPAACVLWPHRPPRAGLRLQVLMIPRVRPSGKAGFRWSPPFPGPPWRPPSGLSAFALTLWGAVRPLAAPAGAPINPQPQSQPSTQPHSRPNHPDKNHLKKAKTQFPYSQCVPSFYAEPDKFLLKFPCQTVKAHYLCTR